MRVFARTEVKKFKNAVISAENFFAMFGAEIVLVYSMVGGPEVPREDFETAENSLEHEKNVLTRKGRRRSGLDPLAPAASWISQLSDD